MQSPLGGSQPSTRRAQALAWTHSVEGRYSVSEQAALIGPVERQIEFGKTRRSEFDGLPALQDRLDQLGAQKGEVDETPSVKGPSPECVSTREMRRKRAFGCLWV